MWVQIIIFIIIKITLMAINMNGLHLSQKAGPDEDDDDVSVESSGSESSVVLVNKGNIRALISMLFMK